MLKLNKKFILFAAVLLLSSPAQATKKVISKKCEAVLKAVSIQDSSTPQGILQHGEHFVDLILSQVGSNDARYFSSFRELTKKLIDAVEEKKIDFINEKIDGSPSIVLGFTQDRQIPFVTYKKDFSGSKQRLVTSAQDAKEGFQGALQVLYSNTIDLLSPRMAKLAQGEFQDYIFQADLLFSPDSDRIVKSEDSIRIQANSIEYIVERVKNPELFERLASSKIGLVIHTIGKRTVTEDGSLSVQSLSRDSENRKEQIEKVKKFVAGLNSKDVFVLDPWQEGVTLLSEKEFSINEKRQLLRQLASIEKGLSRLSPEFKIEWQKRYEKKFRIFFNSFLKPPLKGGIYLDAAEQKPFDFDSILIGFKEWLRRRIEQGKEAKSLGERFEAYSQLHHGELKSALNAYYDAIRIQYLLKPYLESMQKSKLGGGPVEGVLLETDNTIVKLVDRLQFTLLNNQQRNRFAKEEIPSIQAVHLNLPFPFDQWRANSAFVIMKGQPVHSGHLKMIKEAIQLNTGGEIFVVPSDKEPNLDASDWKGLKVSDTKRNLSDKNYTYVFDQSLRREILEAGLKDKVKISFLNPFQLWSYLGFAKRNGFTGKVKLVVGEKEVSEERYTDKLKEFEENLELLPVPMQNDGISATQIRKALKNAAIGNRSEKALAKKFLDQAFVEISDLKQRKVLIQKMIDRWILVDQAVEKVLGE